MLPVRIEMRTGACAAPVGTPVGRWVAGVYGGVDYRRPGRPDLDVRTSRLQSSSRLGSPLALKELFVGYNDLQGAFDGPWNMRRGAGRGIWAFRQTAQGRVEAPQAPRYSHFPLPNPLISPVTSPSRVV